jgi:two-component system CheB/CheR fusion protein
MKKSKPQKSARGNGAGRATGGHEFLTVGIGASAGGIQALKEFFENVPAHSGVAYVVILHLSPDHDSRLAEVLQTVAQIPVTQVKERVKVEPDHVYVVPPNQHLGMYDGHIVVEQNVSVEERRAPVDIFFRTLAESHHARAIAVVLSGTGANGSMGIKRVKERGGAAFVQNPREAEFSEMPRNSIATELIDAVLNVREIPAKIIAYKENLRTVEIPVEPESRPEEETAALREVFTVLRARTGHDFSNYKRPTVLRRIERRINVCELESLPAYAAFIRENPDEAQSLLKDLLISVTNFFRDKEAFEFLERDVVPRIVQDKTSQEQIRVWVAGCATGEEAYSLAMLFAEQTETSPVAPPIQIFATDIDEVAIAAAREGFYTLNDAADISAERLRRFFTKEGDGFRVRRELREMILFANHNLLKDAPFSHLDLVTCRNLLIYFNDTAQERAMETFHFALNPGSFLFLGTSESIDGAGDLYAPVNKEHHIYQSRQAAARIAYPVPDAPPAMRYVETKIASAANVAATSEEQEHRLLERISFGDLHQQLLEQYAPPSIVVNENYDIVHLSERAGRFLQVAGGELSKNLLHLIRPELRLELRTALFQAVQRRANVVAANLKVQTNGHAETVNIQVRPVLREEDTARGFLLVLFEPSSGHAAEASERVLASDEPLARRLEEELERTKAQLRTSVEQYEIQTEELRASNEELQAMNEELRSTAEELETSREELQSVNEELLTVNQELKIKIEELSISNNDFKNLLNSTDIGTIFLDRSLRVKMFTPRVREVFNLIDADINRPLADITTKLNFDDLHTDVERVLDTLHTVEREFVTAADKWYLLRVFPYRTSEDNINGVVVTLFDITGRKAAEDAVRESEAKLANELADTKQLQKISSQLIQEDNADTLYEQILDAARSVMRSEMGSLQMFLPERGELYLLAQRGFDPASAEFWEWVRPDSASTCGVALHKGERVIAEDVETCAFMAGTEDLEFYRLSGIRAVQTTPLISRAGHIVGMISNHWREVHQPSERDLRLLDVLARQAADLIERRTAETALRTSHKRLQMAMNAGRIYSWEMNAATRELVWSENMESVMTFPLPDQIDETFKLIHPDDIEHVTDLINGAIEIGGSYAADYRLIHPTTNEVLWFHSQAAFTDENASGEPRLVGIAQNITERKRGEEALRQSEERYRTLFETMDEGYYVIEMLFDADNKPVDYRFLESNPAFEKLTGLKNAAGKTVRELVPEIEEFWIQKYGEVALTGEPNRYSNRVAGLQGRWYDGYAFRLGGDESRLVAIIFSEITERKRAEEILRESEARFRRAFEIETVGIIFFNAKGDFTGANEAFLSMGGHSLEDMTSGKMNWRDLTPPEWMERSEQAVAELMTKGRTTPYEKEYFRKDGSRFWALFAASRINEDENVEYVLDITESKRAEERLRESEERLRLILESVKDFAIITTDTDGIVTGWRPGAEKAFGWTAQEIIGQSADLTFTPEDRERGVPAQEMKAAREKGSAADERWHVRKDGTRFYVSGVMSPVRHGGKLTGYVKIARDLTEQRRAEESLYRAHEELENRVRERTLELAEANVSLQAEIVERRASQAARVELLRQLVRTQEDERRRIAREMHDQFGQQLTALILKLGMLKAECGARKELCDQLEALEMVARQLDEDVDFFVWELRPTALDDLGLQLALTNYAQNWSKHFGVPVEVHESGMNKYRLNFEIETAFYRITQEALNNVAKHAGATSVSILLERRADSVSLIVEDDGCGFDDENTSGSGDRGLGLAGMRERAALLGGSVEIESSEGEGTTIIARIPTSHATAARERDEKGADE